MKSGSVRWLTGLLALLGFAESAIAHDDLNGGKGIGNASPAGISGNGPFESFNVRLHAHLTLGQVGGGPSNVLANDCWGWTDPQTNREYAILGLTNGTSFIDVTDPNNPIYLGKMNSADGSNTAWRDMKVYNNHTYVVADSTQNHGMQVFDLTRLRGVTTPQTFTSDARYLGISSAHNIAINEQTGYAYIVGARKRDANGNNQSVAAGGLHILDLSDPTNPTLAGNFSADGYTHDTQVVSYAGPDAAYIGREIAFNANEDTLTIVDVTDKSAMTMISRNAYPNRGYAHQGWLSEDQKYFFMDDELDELNSYNNGNGTLIPTRTRIWNVEDLDNPVYLGYHDGEASTIDHNMYYKDGLLYQANYTSGMRVLRVNDAATLDLQEIAFFDSYSPDDNVTFNGAWSVFPYFDSGTIIVSDRQGGLFVLSIVSIPEPSTGLLLGLAGLGAIFRRRRRI